jgi:hypothetical protein
MVTFLLDGAANLGVGALDNSGQATITTAVLSVGTHTVTAVYGGDVNLLASTSLLFTQTVLSATQEIALIVDQVNALVTTGILSSGDAIALTVKLKNAITNLDSGKTADGVNLLNALINQVNAFLKSKRLTSTEAQTLISAIDEAIAAATWSV